jgi:hypothetical protein
MKASILTLRDLFQKDIRYLVPVFQRPYVWNQEDQWEPLWDDVRNTAERYLDELDHVGEENRGAAQQQAPVHFLGAVVVQQQQTGAAEIEARHVIDGQQRLTTLQLLLDAAQEVLEGLAVGAEARRLSRLVQNDDDFIGGDPDSAFKIWPTNVDRDAFRHAMTNGLSVDGFAETAIVQAHEFFQLQIREWLSPSSTEFPQRVHALEIALVALLQMVVIDLELVDDANVIFETLNARGTPLLASDLIRNLILHRARESGLNPEEVSKDHFEELGKGWWREDVRQGRLVRPRVDVFLNYWLVMRTSEEVQASEMFPRFRKLSDGHTDVLAIAEEISTSAKVYRRIEETRDSTRLGLFLYRWEVMQTGVVTPVLMWLLSHHPAALETDRLERVLLALESYLVRRMVCRMTTKDYNHLFLELLDHLERGGPSMADESVIQFLAGQSSDARLWPDDRQIEDVFETLPLYRLLTRGRLRLVLEAIENQLRTTKAESQDCPRGLTIEHVMPQGWRTHWKLDMPMGDDRDKAEFSRDRIVHSMGNLTLVNDRLNPAMSNSEWSVKKDALANHSVLFLNKSLLDSSVPDWDEAQISTRARALAKLAAAEWPSAQQV